MIRYISRFPVTGENRRREKQTVQNVFQGCSLCCRAYNDYPCESILHVIKRFLASGMTMEEVSVKMDASMRTSCRNQNKIEPKLC